MTLARLVPCSSCARHVRAFEQTCPFCAAKLPEAPAPRALARAPGARLTRAALFALGTSASGAFVACSSTAVYGAPAVPYDASVQPRRDASSTDPEDDFDSSVAVPDASRDASDATSE